MQKVSREEKKVRKNNVASSSIVIKKTPKPKRNLKRNKMTEANRVLNISSDSQDENADLRTLILSIKKSQCTKADMQTFTESMNSKLVDIESKVSSQDSKIESMDKRLSACEGQAASAEFQSQLDKQRTLKNNISIFGIIPTEGEKLKQIAVSVFSKIGCAVADEQIVDCYRINGSSNGIVIVKLTDFDVKQKILKEKSKKAVTVGEVVACDSKAAATIIYINNHVTPFFGKLLAEGRKAIKNGDIHSCWLNSFGCQLKLEENGKQYGYRTVTELKKLITGKKSNKRSAPDDRSPAGNNNKSTKK